MAGGSRVLHARGKTATMIALFRPRSRRSRDRLSAAAAAGNVETSVFLADAMKAMPELPRIDDMLGTKKRSTGKRTTTRRSGTRKRKSAARSAGKRTSAAARRTSTSRKPSARKASKKR